MTSITPYLTLDRATYSLNFHLDSLLLQIVTNFPSLICPDLLLFLEAFHACYRCYIQRWHYFHNKLNGFWLALVCWVLILRIAHFGVHTFANDWLEKYTSPQFVCIVGRLAFLFLRLTNDYYNKLDTGMFVLLLGINTLTMYIQLWNNDNIYAQNSSRCLWYTVCSCAYSSCLHLCDCDKAQRLKVNSSYHRFRTGGTG